MAEEPCSAEAGFIVGGEGTGIVWQKKPEADLPPAGMILG